MEMRQVSRIGIVYASISLVILLPFLVPSLSLGQARGHGSITGTVLSLEKQPLENVDVQLYRSDQQNAIWRTLTDEFGAFTFNDLTAGTYSITVESRAYKSKTVDQIRVNNEPKRITVHFSPEDRIPIESCPTCVVYLPPPDVPLGEADLGDPVWNFWMESPPPPLSPVQPQGKIAFHSIYPRTTSNAQAVVDLAAVAYDGFDKATYSRKSDSDFINRLKALVGDSVDLDIIINPDPLYFAKPADNDIMRPMSVNLKKLRDSQARGVELIASPRYLMRLLGEASADYSYGTAAFPIRTLSKTGWAPVNFEVWSHDTNTPLTEATAFFCIVAKDGDGCGPKPENTTVDTLSGVDLAGRGRPPDLAVHISERSNGLVGVFKCNSSFCPDRDYHTWEVGQGSFWLISKLTTALNLLASQEAFAQAHPNQIGSIESEYKTAGRAIFDDVFYSEQRDPGLSTVISAMQTLKAESDKRLSGKLSPPSLFARIMPSSSQLLVVPWALMVVPSADPHSLGEPLGASVQIESPLPLQSYLVPGSCVSSWTLLVPPPRTRDPDDALSALFIARDNVETWISRFHDSCPLCTMSNDPTSFGTWLTGNVPPSGSTGIVVLSHHSTDGNTDAYYMDVDANGFIGAATYPNVSRTFVDPSFAILDACGTGKPSSSEFIHQFNRSGIYSVISTMIDVNPELAGKFLASFMAHLVESSADNDHSIGRAQWLAVKDMSKKFGARAFVFSLSGNSAIKACIPQVSHANPKIGQ